MKYSSDIIANWFLNAVDREAGDSISHLKLQKLVFYAQAWALALLDRELFEEDFEAWAHGPVLPSQYRRFKGSGWNALEAAEGSDEIEPEVEDLLREVYRVYGEKNAKTLERLTHQESPWRDARGGCAPEERCDTVIPKSHMKQFYRSMYEKAQA